MTRKPSQPKLQQTLPTKKRANASGAGNEHSSLHRSGITSVLAAYGLAGAAIDGVEGHAPIQIALERAKLPPRIRFNGLRDTYASLTFAAMFKPHGASRRMGHASVSTTDGICVHLYPSDYNDDVARCEAFIAEA